MGMGHSAGKGAKIVTKQDGHNDLKTKLDSIGIQSLLLTVLSLLIKKNKKKKKKNGTVGIYNRPIANVNLIR